jgi:hypothetical protein
MFQVDKTQQYTTKNKKGLVKYFTDRVIQVKERTISPNLVLLRGDNLAQKVLIEVMCTCVGKGTKLSK